MGLEEVATDPLKVVEKVAAAARASSGRRSGAVTGLARLKATRNSIPVAHRATSQSSGRKEQSPCP